MPQYIKHTLCQAFFYDLSTFFLLIMYSLPDAGKLCQQPEVALATRFSNFNLQAQGKRLLFVPLTPCIY